MSKSFTTLLCTKNSASRRSYLLHSSTSARITADNKLFLCIIEVTSIIFCWISVTSFSTLSFSSIVIDLSCCFWSTLSDKFNSNITFCTCRNTLFSCSLIHSSISRMSVSGNKIFLKFSKSTFPNQLFSLTLAKHSKIFSCCCCISWRRRGRRSKGLGIRIRRR